MILATLKTESPESLPAAVNLIRSHKKGTHRVITLLSEPCAPSARTPSPCLNYAAGRVEGTPQTQIRHRSQVSDATDRSRHSNPFQCNQRATGRAGLACGELGWTPCRWRTGAPCGVSSPCSLGRPALPGRIQSAWLPNLPGNSPFSSVSEGLKSANKVQKRYHFGTCELHNMLNRRDLRGSSNWRVPDNRSGRASTCLKRTSLRRRSCTTGATKS